jgi:hypothetical protein
MENRKPAAILLLIGAIAGTLISFGDLYDRASQWLFPSVKSLRSLELCLYSKCVNDNAEFISKVVDSVGKSVDADFILDVPIGNGEFNARCMSEIPYLYAPEEFYFIPRDLGECDRHNGIVLRIPSEYLLPVNGTSFTQTVRVKGIYSISVAGPESRFEFTKE